jgi:hypothetical protein
MNRSSLTILSAILVSSTGCTTVDQVYLPVNAKAVNLAIPAQQLVISDAIQQAVQTLDFSRFSGKTAYVEINGVFPHSYHEVLDYCSSMVEGRMAMGGMLPVPMPVTVTTTEKEAGGEEEGADEAATKTVSTRHYQRAQDRDYRAVISVGAAGGDIRKFGNDLWYNGVVNMTVHLIPLKPGLEAATYPVTGRAEHQVGGDLGRPYTASAPR